MVDEDSLTKVVDAYNQGDPKPWYVELFASDALLHDPLSSEPLHGRDAMVKQEEELLEAFPDRKLTVYNFLAKGDSAVVEWVFAGTHTGPLAAKSGTIPPTNRRLELRGVSVYRVNREGLVVEARRYYDTASITRQLGLVPAA